MELNQKSYITTTSLAKAIGESIADLRQKNKLTQQNLADSVGLSVQQIQKYEYGDTNISVIRLMKIAKVFDKCLFELLKPSLASYYGENNQYHQFLIDPLDIKLAKLLHDIDPKRKQTLLDFLTKFDN